VLDLKVALVALNFVRKNMGGMHEVGIIEFFQPVRFPVAFVTIFPWDIPVSDYGVTVALVAFESVFKYKGMVVSGSIFRGKTFLAVAVGALADLRIMLALLEVADKTGAVGHSDVLALDDLGMAARAAEAFAPFQVFEVNFVVKYDFRKIHPPFQESLVMAAFAETGFIRNFSPWFGFQVELGPVPSQLHQSIDFCPQL
jgi:hypothetical protein